MMSQAVESSGGQERIVKDLVPFFRCAVAGKDDGLGFIAFADEVIEVFDGLRRKRDKPEVIEDEEVDAGEVFSVTEEGAISAACVEACQERMGGSAESAEAVFEGFEGQSLGEMGFAGTGLPGQDEVLAVLDEVTESQVSDEGFGDLRGGGEIEAGQGFGGIEAGFAGASSQAVVETALDFVIQQEGQEFSWGESLFLSKLGALRQGRQDAREFKFTEFWEEWMG